MTDLSTLPQYAVVAFTSLFIIVDPLTTAPLFVVMTEGDPPDKRRQMARRAACTAFLTLTGFALLGDVLLRLFSLTLSAFRIAGGTIALTQQAPTLGHRPVILAAIVVACSLAYVILGYAVQVTAFLGHTGLRFQSRLLGWLLAAIAVQFIVQGLEETVIRLLHQLR
jgi:multiple antibiotic resistance protein